jgi:hypothetical protein
MPSSALLGWRFNLVTISAYSLGLMPWAAISAGVKGDGEGMGGGFLLSWGVYSTQRNTEVALRGTEEELLGVDEGDLFVGIEGEEFVADAFFAVGVDEIDRDDFVTLGGGDEIEGSRGEADVEEVVGFDRKLHGVGAHVSGLDDPNCRNRDAFGVTVAGDQDQVVRAIGGDAADNLFSGTNFEGLDALGDAPHQGDLLGGEGEAENSCAGGGDDDFPFVGEGSDRMQLVVFAQFDQGRTAIGESAEFLLEDALNFTAIG